MNKNKKNRKPSPPNRGGGNLGSSDEARKKFNSMLLESILECIEFGEVVLRFLELNSAVKRDEIAEKPEKFARELEDLLGDGAKIIEEKIIQKVYAKIGMEYTKTEGYAFPEYIIKAREEYLKRKG